jgi:hypothetical protein
MTLPATSVHSCHYKLHIKKLKYSSTHCSPICKAALLIEGSQLHQFVFLIRRFMERFLSNLWQHGTRQIYGNMGPVKFMATWDPPNLWQHGTHQIYGNMGPVKFMATWDLSNLWQHGTCQIFAMQLQCSLHQCKVKLPRVSTVGNFFTIALRFAILMTPRANVTVTTIGSPSGMAATARLKQ